MTRHILIINGHPDAESFSFALMRAYQRGATEAGHEVRAIRVRDLAFNPNLAFVWLPAAHRPGT